MRLNETSFQTWGFISITSRPLDSNWKSVETTDLSVELMKQSLDKKRGRKTWDCQVSETWVTSLIILILSRGRACIIIFNRHRNKSMKTKHNSKSMYTTAKKVKLKNLGIHLQNRQNITSFVFLKFYTVWSYFFTTLIFLLWKAKVKLKLTLCLTKPYAMITYLLLS